ncbi:RICIN domain-containing protein [Lentzea sp. NPDC005914]|uniref:RICIN domain-containing protein n=1 Tax=Lentzea sp. NPDC005914 TaxID=3154572 RepID=UPI0033C38155
MRIHGSRSFTAIVVALLVAVGVAAPAQAAGFQHIVNTATGKCVDLVDGRTSTGTRVHQWSCGSESSRWSSTDLGNGFIQLHNRTGGLCLSLVWGTLIVDIRSCNDRSDQRLWWRWESADPFGNLVLRTPPAGGSACLALLPFSNSNGTSIGIADCATTSAQIWQPRPAGT